MIEPLMRDEINTPCKEIQVYCFYGMPKFVIKLHNDYVITLFDENKNYIDGILSKNDINIFEKFSDLLKQSFDLSRKLSQEFDFVRCDFMIYQDKVHFEELTFTPYSGFNKYANRRLSLKEEK